MSASQYPIPTTPRVISPSPTPSERSGKDGYFPQSGSKRLSSPEQTSDDGEHPELARARSRSRSPGMAKKGSRRLDGMTPIPEKADQSVGSTKPTRRKPELANKRQDTQDHLKPSSAAGLGRAYWRALSRSPSPLGLIPIHREWRIFIHKHEIPRKAMHVSIGFVTLFLYTRGYQAHHIHPVLLSLLIPIFLVDIVRMQYAPFNQFYIRILGPFMRECEAHDKYNGVISYLGGTWAVIYFCPKDVAVVSILMLSFCDTAASTFGRLYGRYTPRIRKGKSLAGSIAAFCFGVVSAFIFYKFFGPIVPQEWNTGENRFAFDGHLTLPYKLRQQLDLSRTQATIQDNAALIAVSLVSGLIASMSEAVDLFELDDNLTIPILCGLGLGAFLKAFR